MEEDECENGCKKRVKTPTEKEIKDIKYEEGEMEDKIKKIFDESTFNKCPHNILPEMNIGPKMNLKIDPKVKKPRFPRYRNIPINMKDEVKKQLDDDERDRKSVV